MFAHLTHQEFPILAVLVSLAIGIGIGIGVSWAVRRLSPTKTGDRSPHA